MYQVALAQILLNYLSGTAGNLRGCWISLITINKQQIDHLDSETSSIAEYVSYIF
jgi:hypothetical protein